MHLYLNPAGVPIDAKAWKARRPDDYLLHRHIDKTLQVELWAADVVRNANLLPADKQMRFRMTVFNILTTDALGAPLEAPKVVPDKHASAEFASRSTAIAAYRAFLHRWANLDAACYAELDAPVPTTAVDATLDEEAFATLTALLEADASSELSADTPRRGAAGDAIGSW